MPDQETTALPATAETVDEPIAEKKATTPIPTPAARGEISAEPSKPTVETTPPTPEPVEKPAMETVIEAEQPAKMGVGETPEPVTEAPAAPDTEEPAEIVPAAAIAPEPRAPTPPEPILVAKNDAFMPPPPVDPKRPPEAVSGADPFKEADLLNGSQKDDSRRRGGNLFQRITRTGKIPTHEPPTVISEAKTAPAPTKPVPVAKNLQKTALQQSRLAGVDPEDRVQTSQAEDDLLEIPAFLRRQAN